MRMRMICARPASRAQATLDGLRELDSPTIFNAVGRLLKDTTPRKRYTDHTARNLLPALGAFVSFAVPARAGGARNCLRPSGSHAADWVLRVSILFTFMD